MCPQIHKINAHLQVRLARILSQYEGSLPEQKAELQAHVAGRASRRVDDPEEPVSSGRAARSAPAAAAAPASAAKEADGELVWRWDEEQGCVGSMPYRSPAQLLTCLPACLPTCPPAHPPACLLPSPLAGRAWFGVHAELPARLPQERWQALRGGLDISPPLPARCARCARCAG